MKLIFEGVSFLGPISQEGGGPLLENAPHRAHHSRITACIRKDAGMHGGRGRLVWGHPFPGTSRKRTRGKSRRDRGLSSRAELKRAPVPGRICSTTERRAGGHGSRTPRRPRMRPLLFPTDERQLGLQVLRKISLS